MPRKVEEWCGRTDDTAIPPRVRLRVWTRLKGLCGQCGRQIRAGERWTLEHVVALINGGENREGNLGLTCCNCLPGKNAADVAAKSLVARKRSKHLSAKPKRPWNTKWRKKMSGLMAQSPPNAGGMTALGRDYAGLSDTNRDGSTGARTQGRNQAWIDCGRSTASFQRRT